MSTTRPWEVGSEFHWIEFPADVVPRQLPDDSLLLGSGRDALRLLLAHGKMIRGWRRIWVPSYYCQEVIQSIRECNIEVCFYRDSPLAYMLDLGSLPLAASDALLVVNYFGLRTLESVRPYSHDYVDIIEDHTHNPWSVWARTSRAQWCFASLRKTLPLPDGGMLWSPVGLPLPKEPALSPLHEKAANMKLTAMLLKSLYLSGYNVSKPSYREIQISAERLVASGDISGILPFTRTILPLLPIPLWQSVKRSNIEKLVSIWPAVPGIRLLLPTANDCDLCPFGAIVVFESSTLCQAVRRHLGENDVYTAVLWPQSENSHGIIMSEHELSHRLLMIHCDMRYGYGDMERVAELITQSGEITKGG